MKLVYGIIIACAFIAAWNVYIVVSGSYLHHPFLNTIGALISIGTVVYGLAYLKEKK